MDKEMEEELKDMRLGFEEMQIAGELSNLDIDSLMVRIRKSMEEEKIGKLQPVGEVIEELKSKYLKSEVY